MSFEILGSTCPPLQGFATQDLAIQNGKQTKAARLKRKNIKAAKLQNKKALPLY